MSAAPAVVPAAVPARRPPRTRAERVAVRLGLYGGDKADREFLPAHLEVLETPPSPLALAILWTVAAFFAGVVGWSLVARIDIYATAQGRVQPTGRSKVVQPPETGRIHAIRVSNGDAVKAGQAVVVLDEDEADADMAGRKADLGAIDAQVARRVATLAAVRDDMPSPPEPGFSHLASPEVEAQERAAMRSDVDQYVRARDALLSQVAENAATQGRLNDSIAARERLLSILRERASMKETLAAHQSGSRAGVLDATQQVEQASADLANDRGNLVEARAAVQSLRRKVDALKGDTLAKQDQALADAMEKRLSATHEVLKAGMHKDRLTLRSPIDGTVQQVSVGSAGQVVSAGQPLMVVVPTSGPVEVEALVPGSDIGFVVAGQRAVAKLDAFPFTRYGTIEGEVVRVSRDAVDEREAVAGSDPVASSKGQSVAQQGSVADTRNLVYPVTVKLDRTSIEADGRDVALAPGMTASIEIRTGDRRVADYVLAPMRETASSAGHER